MAKRDKEGVEDVVYLFSEHHIPLITYSTFYLFRYQVLSEQIMMTASRESTVNITWDGTSSSSGITHV